MGHNLETELVELTQRAAYAASRWFGSDYAKSMRACRVGDMLPMFVGYLEPLEDATRFDTRMKMADAANEVLVKEKVASRLLRCIGAKLQHQDKEFLKWVDQAGLLDCDAVRRFIEKCSTSDPNLADALARLCRLEALDEQGQLQELRSDKGAGIMCWFATAHPNLYLDETNKVFTAPPFMLKWGLCGKAEFNGCYSARFDTAVVQHRRDFEGAVAELRLRLGALSWLFECMPDATYFYSVTLMGRVFVGHKNDVSEGRRELAWSLSDWGFELEVHRC
ncbi:hypothetical protein JKP88DRAFT_241715 [Tribonema minus]|uniref:Uncharacterized protein n=1 Tax=Tribonema minus TaxID=303371 RepID=A0A835YTF1_9STRA|nr:hypothetical protein JKP88DRAFT_241715 [Tribonema minus]